MTKYISILSILKQSGKFNLVNIVSNVLSIPKSILIAIVLAPQDYGVISYLGLWSMYAGFINPGFLSTRNREMAYFIGKSDEKQAIRIQNISHTSDFIYSLIPFMVIFSASFFFSDSTLKIGFILTALTYALTHLVSYWRGVNFIRQNFNIVAKVDLIQSVSTMVLIFIFIWKLKIYAVLAAPLVGAFIACIYYWQKGKIGYQFLFDWPETIRLFKIGISFSLLVLIYWGYRLIDKTIIAALLPMNELGLYSYATVYVFMGLMFISDFGNVFAPILWTKTGQTENRTNVLLDTKRIAIYLSIFTAIMIPFSQLCFYLLVKLVTKKFIGSIPVFIILSNNLYLSALVMIPSLILQSTVVNKQVLSLKTYAIGLTLNIIFDLLAIRLGYGILSIAFINVLIQGIVTFWQFYLVRDYIFTKNTEFPAFILHMGLPFLVSLGFSLFHTIIFKNIVNLWTLGIISIPVQLVIWIGVILMFYRKYFSRYNIDRLKKLFKDFLFKFLRIGQQEYINEVSI